VTKEETKESLKKGKLPGEEEENSNFTNKQETHFVRHHCSFNNICMMGKKGRKMGELYCHTCTRERRQAKGGKLQRD
jgi:hypothetical protein